MNRLTLYRFDDAFDRHVLVRDSRAMIELLSSPELRAIGEARALAGALAETRIPDAGLRRELMRLRTRIEDLVEEEVR